MTTTERKLVIATEVAAMYRSKALYFNCLAKRRFRPQFECCKECSRKTEDGEFCEFIYCEIDSMSGLKEDEPKESQYLGNNRFGKPKKKRPHKKARNSAKAKR